jgi:uncharacterized membrane protein
MEKTVPVRNPLEWAAAYVEGLAQARPPEFEVAGPSALPVPRQITVADVRASLADGYADFLAFRSDVIVLCFMYPVAGAVLWRFATGHNLVQLVFPLVAGFALVGPLFATGLYEMSRQRERGQAVTWATAFDAFRSPRIIRIAALGAALVGVFLVWLLTAQWLYGATVGAAQPATAGEFVHDVVMTGPGVMMAITGVTIGFAFATLVLCTSVISFPLLLDRPVTIVQAVRASVAAVRLNRGTMAVWGCVVAAGLAVGAAPFLVGLIVVVPILGHATWHLYRRVVM